MRLAPVTLVALATLAACGSKTPAPDAAPPATTAPTTTAPATTAEPDATTATTAPTTTAEPDAAAPTAAEEVAAAPEPTEPGEPPPPPPPAALPEPVAVTGACIKDLADGGPIGWVDVVDGKVRLCRWDGQLEGAGAACWALDIGARTLASVDVRADLAELAKGGEWKRTWPEGVKVEGDGAKVTWCPTKETCHALDLGGMTVGQAAVQGDRLVVAPDSGGGTESKPMSALVFGADGKQVGAIPLATAEDTGCPDVAWAGSSVWVTLGVCAGPGAKGWLADPVTGKRRAWFGGGADADSAWSAYGVTPVMVAPEVAAFREQYGNEVVFHDTTTGAVVRRADLRASQGKDPDTGEPRTGSPEEGTMVLVGDTLVVTQGDAARDTIVLVEAATGKVSAVLKLPACAP